MLLVPLRPFLHRVLSYCGHGELLVLAGLAATLGGAGLFYAVGLKGDLGALVAGVLLGGHAKSSELAKSLAGLKNVFLVGFFLMVGLTGLPSLETALVGAALLVFIPVKGLLFLLLAVRFRLRARTSLLGALALTQYSEFGLIVGALAVSSGLLREDWLVSVAIAVAGSFLLSTALNQRAFSLYARFRERLGRLERPERLDEEQPVDASGAEVLVMGMGRVGAGAYDRLVGAGVGEVIGFDVDDDSVQRNRREGRRVVLASATDVDFWQRLRVDPAKVKLVVLAMSSHVENKLAVAQLRAGGFPGYVVASARYDDEVTPLRAAGADAAFHVMAEAGSGLADHALGELAAARRRDPDAADEPAWAGAR